MRTLSGTAVGLVVLILLATSWVRKAPGANDPQTILRYDGYGYFVYLPALFVYGDTEDYAFADSLRATYQISADLYQVRYTADSTAKSPIYNGGLALLWAPGYLVVHELNRAFGWAAADGHSLPYLLVPLVTSWLALLLGLLLLRRFLRRFFDDWIVALTTVGIGLGTNYFYYATEAPDMTHLYLFTGYAAFLEVFAGLSDSEHRARSRVLWGGLIAGLLCLIRSSEIVVFLIPAAYQLSGRTFGRNFRWTAAMVAAALPVFGLQLLFYKLTTGSWWHDGYAGLGFDWFAPHVWEGLFSYRRGWLVYTPLMIFGLAGIAVAPRGWRLPLLLFTVANVYLLFSWHIWWYGNTFGSRPVVQSYAVLALPLAASFHYLTHPRAAAQMVRWRQVVLGVGVVLLIGLNLFQTWQYHRRILPLDFVNEAYYWAVFGKTDLDRKRYVLLDTGARAPVRRLVEWEEGVTTYAAPKPVPARKSATDPEFTEVFEHRVPASYPEYGASWVRVELDFDYLGQAADKWRHPKLVTEVYRGEAQIDWQAVNLARQLRGPAGGRDTAAYYLKVPSLLAGDRIKHYVWNNSADSLWLRSFRSELHHE